MKFQYLLSSTDYCYNEMNSMECFDLLIFSILQESPRLPRAGGFGLELEKAIKLSMCQVIAASFQIHSQVFVGANSLNCITKWTTSRIFKLIKLKVKTDVILKWNLTNMREIER